MSDLLDGDPTPVRPILGSCLSARIIWFRRRREDAGLSMNALAAGLDQMAIARVESGGRTPNLRTAIKMADALDARLSEVLAEAGH